MPAGAIHTLMMPVRNDGKGNNVLAHAAVLAKRFGARVRLVHCRPTAQDLMPFGVVMPRAMRADIEESAKRNADHEFDLMMEEFNGLTELFGLPQGDRVAGQASSIMVEYDGKQVDAVRHWGRLADMILVPQPEAGLGVNTLKTALFSSGRPVMMCPEVAHVADDFADHVAIAWNGSLEASRAVALSMPLIEAAERVTILTGGTPNHTASPEDLAAYLAIRGVTAEVRRFDAKGTVGNRLLEESREAGAGLMVMGAYHESYERESVFGGNSQAVVDSAKIPVVLVH